MHTVHRRWRKRHATTFGFADIVVWLAFTLLVVATILFLCAVTWVIS